MTKSKLTHVEKDKIITEMQDTLDNMTATYKKHVQKNTDFLNLNKNVLIMQNNTIDKLQLELSRLTIINWLLTATIGVSIGLVIYFNWS